MQVLVGHHKSFGKIFLQVDRITRTSFDKLPIAGVESKS
jgi:hypothetical protein